MRATSIIVVEDQIRGAKDLVGAHGAKLKAGIVLPPIAVWDPAQTQALMEGRSSSVARRWSQDEVLLLDCRDRDSAAEPNDRFRSVFFALDLLAALRDAKDHGATVPRVIAYSKAMHDPLVRAALGEFMAIRTEVHVNHDGVTRAYRLDVADGKHNQDGVLWAMFDRSVLERHLDRVVMGDRTTGLRPPGPEDPVWNEFLPNSCLASFHLALRDQHPEVWGRCVLGGEPPRLGGSARRAINRLGYRYLEPNPMRGGLTYVGYIDLARSLAMPDY